MVLFCISLLLWVKCSKRLLHIVSLVVNYMLTKRNVKYKIHDFEKNRVKTYFAKSGGDAPDLLLRL